MKLLNISATNNTPMVSLDTEGKMVIQGRSYNDDATNFYGPVIDWIKGFSSQKLILEIRLEYLNKSSLNQIYYLLKSVKGNEKIIKATIQWYYEDDDEEMLDIGKTFESQISIPFKFYGYFEHVN